MKTVKDKNGYYVVVQEHEGDNQRGVVYSLGLAFSISFVVGNIMVGAFFTFGGIIGDFGFLKTFQMHYGIKEYVTNILFAMFMETLIWRSAIVAYFAGRIRIDLTTKEVVKL